MFGCLRLVVCGVLVVVVLLFAFYFALIVVFGYIIRFIWAFLHRLVLLGCGWVLGFCCCGRLWFVGLVVWADFGGVD